MNSDNRPEKNVQMILNSLRDMSTSVMHAAEADSLEEVLERIAHVSKELVQVRYSALGIPDKKGGLRFFKVAGMTPQQIKHVGHLPTGEGLLGVIMNERQPIRLTNMRDDSRSSGFCSHHPAMSSFLGVPIQVASRLYGMLYLCDRLDGQPFNDEDQWLVETMAGYAALAIAGAELSEQQSLVTLLEERERIGMELHDGIIQSLYAVGMQLDLLRLNGEIAPNDLMPTISELNNVIEDIRGYILDLKTRTDKTILVCLRELVDRLYVPASVQIRINAPDIRPSISAPKFDALCQITNEALSNALRHSGGKTITITASQTSKTFAIRVTDDGQGFDSEAVRESHSGLGLLNMKQRALLYKGRIDIQTAEGMGTILTISVPL